VNGRKRHLAVDVLGLPLAIHVSAVDIHDGQGGFDLLWQIEKASDRMEIIRGDNHYKGVFSEYAAYYKWTVEVTKKPESHKGFVPQIGRWQVERSFGWFNYFRRLSRDFEKTVESAAAFIKLAFIDIILSRFPN
jgi:transposase